MSLIQQKQSLPKPTQNAQPHVAIVPTPGIGHLIPLVELANRLVHHHGFAITFIVPNDGSSMSLQRQLLQTTGPAISSIFLPPLSFPEDSRVETRITLTLTRSLHYVHDSLKSLAESTHLVAYVVDLFGSVALELGKEFGLPSYMFFTTTAMNLSFVFHLPTLHETYSCEYRDLPGPVQMPGCYPIHGSDLIHPVQDRKNEGYKWILEVVKLFTLADGIMVNSFMDLEAGALKALMDDNRPENQPPIFPVGPLVRTDSRGRLSSKEMNCLKWLDEQPSGSVLFVSFGSGGTLSHAQLSELAFGLEMSGQRFLWVVRAPNDKAAYGSYFGGQIVDPLKFLPNGFLDKTKGVGLLVPSWAPQIEILSHGSTGGFLTHCGWNSTLESIVHGVPLIAWPLFADQKMNAVLLSDDLKVALRVKENPENGLVCRDDIANYVKVIFGGEEGKAMKKKMQELKNAASKVLGEDGSSTKSLADVAKIWKTKS